MDGGAWWAAVHGVAKSQTGLSDFTFTFHFHALEKEMATHCSVLAWRIPGTGEPGRLPSMGSRRVRHDWSDLAAAAFIGRTEAETTIFWSPDVKKWLIGKDPGAGKDWRQEEKGTTEDEMVGWHHWLDEHEFERALGAGDGQGGLACCSPWSLKESDTTGWLNWTDTWKFDWLYIFKMRISQALSGLSPSLQMRKLRLRISLVVQWLTLCPSIAVAQVLSFVRGVKIPQCVRHGQKIERKLRLKGVKYLNLVFLSVDGDMNSASWDSCECWGSGQATPAMPKRHAD